MSALEWQWVIVKWLNSVDSQTVATATCATAAADADTAVELCWSEDGKINDKCIRFGYFLGRFEFVLVCVCVQCSLHIHCTRACMIKANGQCKYDSFMLRLIKFRVCCGDIFPSFLTYTCTRLCINFIKEFTHKRSYACGNGINAYIHILRVRLQ